MVELKDVSCSFSDRLVYKGRFTTVSSMTANFEDGSRYAIVGESGPGKTALARMIAGLQHPSAGAISADGSLVYGRTGMGKEHFKKVQIIQQNSASTLDPKLPIRRSIEEPLLCFFQVGKAQRREWCRQLTELCSLPGDYYTRLPSKLSGGEQKRVTVVRALAAEPQRLILNETANGFDLPLQKKIIDRIIDPQYRLDFTLIFIIHGMELAVAAADEIFVMRNFNLVEHTAFSDDYSVFQNPYNGMLLKASDLTGAPSDRNNKMRERIALQ